VLSIPWTLSYAFREKKQDCTVRQGWDSDEKPAICSRLITTGEKNQRGRKTTRRKTKTVKGENQNREGGKKQAIG
jgi:hypothetical protein